jgi:hypothetical protein
MTRRRMTRQKEATLWRRIGRAFEALAEGSKPDISGEIDGVSVNWGLCAAACYVGLPAYNAPGARVRASDHMGQMARGLDSKSKAWPQARDAAACRALTAYLIAEMVKDGRAPCSYKSLTH